MTPSIPSKRGGRARAYGLALIGVVLIGGVYFWANTGPAAQPDRGGAGARSSAAVVANPPPP